jgi:hypothetical protein
MNGGHLEGRTADMRDGSALGERLAAGHTSVGGATVLGICVK